MIAEENPDKLFNPASIIKIAVSYAALKKLGPDHQFATSVYTDGAVDEAGRLSGNLIVAGANDPSFRYESVFLISEKLRSMGISSVAGDLIVAGPFYFNFDGSRGRSAEKFFAALQGVSLSPAVELAWDKFLSESNREWIEFPGVAFDGAVRTANAIEQIDSAEKLRLLAVHLSPPLRDLLKIQNDYSSNFYAEIIGGSIGGPRAIESFLIEEVGLSPNEVMVGTASGLGENRLSARAALKLFRNFYEWIGSRGINIEQLLPVAGIDEGTLEGRFDAPELRGSVVAKTGTLLARRSSSLVGLAYTRDCGIILFAILNRDLVPNARKKQDELITGILNRCGGPLPVLADHKSALPSSKMVVLQGSPHQ